MPWNETTVENCREDFIREVLAQQVNISCLCRQYGISRPTGYKWLNRASAGAPMTDKSRCPFRTANRVSAQVEQMILAQRKSRPAIGALKQHKMLENKGVPDLPCPSTFNAIYKRNGCISKEASAATTPYRRFVHEHPNDLWQMDFKGHFEMLNGQRCHPLNIIDDHSRFCLCSEALLGESLELVHPIVERVFYEFGLPRILLCDNGTPWGTAQRKGFSLFEVWLMEHAILPMHGRARHPQTQGKQESYNKSMKRELLRDTTIADLQDAQQQFAQHVIFHNNERPHHALKLDRPVQHYRKSERAFMQRVYPWEYPDGYQQFKITNDGYVTFRGRGYYLSESFSGKTIAIRPSRLPDCVTLCFREFIIARIDLNKFTFKQKGIYLAEGDPRSKLPKDK